MINFANGIASAVDRNAAATYALLLNWAGQLEGYAKENADWQDRTSHARQSIHAGVERNGDEMILYLSHGMEYSICLELGTPPHLIKPAEKKALYWPGAPHPVKQVNHPGTRAYAIVGPTMDAHAPRIRESVQDLWGD